MINLTGIYLTLAVFFFLLVIGAMAVFAISRAFFRLSPRAAWLWALLAPSVGTALAVIIHGRITDDPDFLGMNLLEALAALAILALIMLPCAALGAWIARRMDGAGAK